MNELVPVSLEQSLSQWRQSDLVPVEIGQADVQQNISVRHDALSGELHIEYQRCDAVQALGILAETMAAIFREQFQVRLAPPTNSGPAEVHAWLDERGQIRVSFGLYPHDGPAHPDPVVARGLLAAALFGLSGADYDPLEALTNGIFLRVGGQDGGHEQ